MEEEGPSCLEPPIQVVEERTNSHPRAAVTRSSTTVCFWQRSIGLAQVTKLRGNCWRKHGFSINCTNFFYPEEALYLFEKGCLLVTKTLNGTDYMTKQELYEAVLQVISLSCFLTYSRLKNLDYIVFRHKKTIHAFSDSQMLYDHLQQNPSLSLVDAMVSFDLFLEEEGFSKKAIKEKSPTSYVVVTDAEAMFPLRVTLKLIDEASAVPVLFSAISSTGFVILEEVSDAEKSLDMKNSKRNLKKIYSRPMMGKYVDLSHFEEDDDEEKWVQGGKEVKTAETSADEVAVECSLSTQSKVNEEQPISDVVEQISMESVLGKRSFTSNCCVD